MRLLALALTLNLLSVAGTAEAKTAYGSPNGPAPASQTEITQSIATTPPSGARFHSDLGVNKTASLAASSIAGDQPPSARFLKWQHAIDRETVICTRCD